jgi:hypothetical protein
LAVLLVDDLQHSLHVVLAAAQGKLSVIQFRENMKYASGQCFMNPFCGFPHDPVFPFSDKHIHFCEGIPYGGFQGVQGICLQKSDHIGFGDAAGIPVIFFKKIVPDPERPKLQF